MEKPAQSPTIGIFLVNLKIQTTEVPWIHITHCHHSKSYRINVEFFPQLSWKFNFFLMRVANFWIFALLCCTNGSYLSGISTKNSILMKNDFQNSWVDPWSQPGAGEGAARDAILNYVKHSVVMGFSITSVANFGSLLFMMHKWCLSCGTFNQKLNFDGK